MHDDDGTTSRPARWELVAAVGPPLLLAAMGLLHPHDLDDGTASRWTGLHVALLPVFPLLAVAPWLVVRRGSRLLGRLTLVLGYVYALAYTALDVLAGIGTGALQRAGEQDGIPVLFATGNALSLAGVYAYLAAALLASAVAVRRAGARALPGAVVVVLASVSFLGSHVYWPAGVLTMLGLAVGWALLLLASPGDAGGSGEASVRGRHGSRTDSPPLVGDHGRSAPERPSSAPARVEQG